MKTPTYPATPFPKQNIYQLAKMARRIPRVLSHNLHKLTSGKKLTDREAVNCQHRIAGAHAAQRLLNTELVNRNIGGKPLRDCTPHKKRGVRRHSVQLSTLVTA